jgi:glutaredoxin-like protein NrdH
MEAAFGYNSLIIEKGVNLLSIIVYSKPHCIECNLLKRFLHDHHIAYEARNCSENPQYLAEVKAMGYLGVPVTVVNGTAFRGFTADTIDGILAATKGT